MDFCLEVEEGNEDVADVPNAPILFKAAQATEEEVNTYNAS